MSNNNVLNSKAFREARISIELSGAEWLSILSHMAGHDLPKKDQENCKNAITSITLKCLTDVNLYKHSGDGLTQ
jgi:hypothetical protein